MFSLSAETIIILHLEGLHDLNNSDDKRTAEQMKIAVRGAEDDKSDKNNNNNKSSLEDKNRRRFEGRREERMVRNSS